MNFSSWNIICFGQKESISMQFFILLSAVMKVQPIPHAIFETIGSGFIPILHHCSVSWEKDNSSIFLVQTFYTLNKRAHQSEVLDFWVVGWKFTKFLVSYLKQQVSFSHNFASLFSVMRDNSFCTFSTETLYDLVKRSPSKPKISDF